MNYTNFIINSIDSTEFQLKTSLISIYYFLLLLLLILINELNWFQL